MKTKVYFLFALIFVLNSANAQTNFAPLGATWHHSGRGGIFKTTAVKDTLIDGQNCRKLSQNLYFSKPLEFPFNLFYHSTTDVFVYGTEDTVFIYNPSYRRFTPLYIFNVKIGDTVRLPYINFINCAYVLNDTNKASLSFVIDSVKYIDYKGTLLKTIYSKVLKTKYSYFGWCNWDDSLNIYSQKIGSPNFGLLPQCLFNCAYTTGEAICPLLDSIICYQDKDISIKFRDTCLSSSWVPASINEQKVLSASLKPYPNPAYHSITVKSTGFDFKTSVRVFDVLGHMHIEENFAQQSIIQVNIEQLASGIYYLQLTNTEDKSSTFTRFVKQ